MSALLQARINVGHLLFLKEEMMILIIGQKEDPHVQAVNDRLRRFGCKAVIFDVFSKKSSGINRNISDEVLLSIGDQNFDFSETTAVWWRQKAKFVVPSDSVVGLYDYFFIQREWNAMFDYIGDKSTDCWAINDRQKAKLADNKISQLENAPKYNLTVPKTIVTNSANDVISFFDRAGIQRCVHKSFSPYMPPDARIAFTTEIDLCELPDHSEEIETAPGIFQELIIPKYELRVTVVGTEVFAVRVDSPTDSQNTDWRKSIFENEYTKIKLDSVIEKHLLDYHKNLGLFFAAYDFIVDERDSIFFLEVNPAGQWMWLEKKLSLPISKSIAQALMDHA